MNMHDEQYRLSIADGHKEVEIRDLKAGESLTFTGPKCLWDALGILADWRERDAAIQNKQA